MTGGIGNTGKNVVIGICGRVWGFYAGTLVRVTSPFYDVVGAVFSSDAIGGPA